MAYKPILNDKAKQQAQLEKQGYFTARKRESDKFNHSTEWRALRKQAFARYGNACHKCGQTANQTILCVDHIKPRFFYPELALNIENLQILCKQCNYEKSDWNETDYRPK